MVVTQQAPLRNQTVQSYQSQTFQSQTSKKYTQFAFRHALSQTRPQNQVRLTQALGSNQQRSRLPILPGFAFTPDTDSGVLGDAVTRFSTVDLVGLTSANATVTLTSSALTTPSSTLTTQSDAAGNFLFSNIPLAVGKTLLTATAVNRFGSRRFSTTLERVAADNTDAVLDWNATVLRTIQTDPNGLKAARALAIAQVAVFDAVNALSGGTARSYQPIPVAVPTRASAASAVAGAAYQVLTQLYPNQKIRLDSTLTTALGQIQDAASAKQTGFEFGQTVANGILAARSNDGSDRIATYQPKIKPGKWRPTPPRYRAATGVAWKQVTPFALTGASQFRPAPPPKLTSRAYARDLNQVKRLGQIDSPARTATQTEIARFWLGNLFTAAGMWNEITEQVAAQSNRTLLQNAQLFAGLNLALADASIAAWDAKYTYQTWRPVTAIRLASLDRNPATQADRQWQSFLETPPHPDYVSGHSTFAGAAAAVLTSVFGNRPLTTTSFDLPGMQRSFQSFSEAAAEAGISRIYGGIHTMSANRAGLKLGNQVGNYVLQQFPIVKSA
jgi:hypothetical protein